MLICVVRECAIILILGELTWVRRVNYTPVPPLYIILSNNVNELINRTHLAKRSVKVHYVPGAAYDNARDPTRSLSSILRGSVVVILRRRNIRYVAHRLPFIPLRVSSTHGRAMTREIPARINPCREYLNLVFKRQTFTNVKLFQFLSRVPPNNRIPASAFRLSSNPSFVEIQSRD